MLVRHDGINKNGAAAQMGEAEMPPDKKVTIRFFIAIRNITCVVNFYVQGIFSN
jgi:hypothetical protein